MNAKPRTMTFSLHPRSFLGRLARTLAVPLSAILVLESIPVWAEARPAAEPETAPSELRQVPAPAPAPPPLARPNRHRPPVVPPPAYALFSDEPTLEDLFRARVFGEPLVPVGGDPSALETRELARAIEAFQKAGDIEKTEPFEDFLKGHPSSAWRASLLANLGGTHRQASRYSKAEQALEQAWQLSRGESGPRARDVADKALGELLDLHMLFGRQAPLERLIGEAEGRDVQGHAAQMLDAALFTVWGLRNEHHRAVPSGPAALAAILKHLGKEDEGEAPLEESGEQAALNEGGLTKPLPGHVPLFKNRTLAAFHATPDGASLREMETLAREVGLEMQMAFRESDEAKIPAPSMLHWRGSHFSAVVGRTQGGGLHLQDPILGGDVYLSRRALLEESSGHFLIPAGPLPEGWRRAEARVGEGVRGKCHYPFLQGGGTGQCAPSTGCPPAGRMAGYRLQLHSVGVSITDSPVGYAPPRGPAVEFTVTYNQRESKQPTIFSFSNLGKQWVHDFMSYVEDNPSSPSANVEVALRGGGRETYQGFDGVAYDPHYDSRAVLRRISTSPLRYERTRGNGSLEVFALSDGALTSPRRVFLTEIRDPQGNALQLTYDAQLRLVALTDALGQVTTISYELLSDPLKITSVTDPFGRLARFRYNDTGQLIKIIDVIGIESSMEYGTGSFVRGLTTPYGTTTFRWDAETTILGYEPRRWVEATDPLGATEHVEFLMSSNQVPTSDPQAPTGFTGNSNLHLHNTYYWDKRAWALYANDFSKAEIIHWLKLDIYAISQVKGWEKKPLENRVWYEHQSSAVPGGVGQTGRPSKIGRVLDDGTSQIEYLEFDSLGHLTRSTDPLGRETVFEYDATNGTDLLRVKQKNGAGYDLLAELTYNAQHLPLTATDAAGKTTTLVYNGSGRVTSLTNAKNETTSFGYDQSGYLQTITGPVTGATVGLTWDSYGRVRTVTYDSRTVTLDYDLMDRPTKLTYPDASFEQVGYDRLDASTFRDRLGRTSQVFHDAVQRVTSVRDPLGRMVTQQWCACGSLEKLVDAAGNVTSWETDPQGRVIKQIRSDSSYSEVLYESATSRVKQVKDAKGQLSKYEYFLDDVLKRVRVTNPSDLDLVPSVSFTYDANYPRPLTKLDGIGTTSYAYHAITVPPALGAGQLASEDGPLTNDTLAYSYDELGRVTGTTIAGVAQSQVFDALGRVTSHTNALGTFSYGYVGTTGRPSSVGYPNGQGTSFSYFGVTGDDRLQEILHSKPGGALLARHAYTYDANGNIKTWTQETDTSAAKMYELGYDRADQLTSATLKTTGGTPTLLKRYAYTYDSGGNRTTEQIDDAATQALHNNLNQITSLQPGGALKFAGSLNEAGSITVQGKPATVDATNRFEGAAQVGAGTSQVAVQATDLSGNVRTNTYEVSVAGATKTLTYDASGNLTSDGTRTYEWDALDQLTAVNQGTHRSEFTYDGEGRRIKILEKENGTVTEDRRFLWVGTDIAEERDAAANTVKRYLSGGLQQGGSDYFFTGDHLGSLREMTDNGAAVQARYDYDPYGRRTKATGGLDADLGFTGHFAHAASGLALAVYRSYDASTGRWLSRDPIGLRGGVNLYGYAENRPISSLDPLGLACVNWGQAAVSLLSGVIVGAAIAVVLGVALSALAIPAGLLFAVKLGFIIGGLLGTASAAGSAYYQFKAGCTNQAFNTLGMIIGGALVGMTFAGTAGLRPPAGGRGGAGPVLQGQAGVQKAITTIQAAGGRIRGQQVSVIAANGVRTIIDLVVMFGGRLVFIEVKNGLGAVLRPGQALALPSVATSGGTGVGANAAAAGLLGPIPPTPVGVINVFPWP